MPSAHRHKKNLKIMAALFGLVFMMIALSFAAVPLYDLFCRVTGYGGTTGYSESLPEVILDRKITVRFNTDTAQNLNWSFDSVQESVEVYLGQGALVAYHAKNLSEKPIAGIALYNVSPAKAGQYFKKIECFCFAEQILQPREKVTMPVYFYIDPTLDSDPFLNEVKTITLSYTFFPTQSDEYEQALEQFYEEGLDSGS